MLFFRNARARNTHIEATLNLSCPAQVAPNFEEEMRNYVRPPPDAQGFESVFTTELFRCQELWFGAQEKFQGPEKVHTAPAACWHSRPWNTPRPVAR